MYWFCLLLFALIHFEIVVPVICNSFDEIRPEADEEIQTLAVQQLLQRILPKDYHRFNASVDISLSKDGFDVFNTETQGDGRVRIVGSSGVAAAAGIHQFLKYFCNCHISWEGRQLQLPEYFPIVNLTTTSKDRFRYYQNVCTTSYSFVWWNWKQWEQHIDWIVLNSFNLVLTSNGQEAIWQKVYKKLNLTDEEIDEHFTGPAFLSWNRMGNLRGWGGPLSAAWHNHSINLQKSIIRRLRSFGVITVLPSFSGIVPQAFARIFPEKTMAKLPAWNKFNETYCCPYLLDPTDPFFTQVGILFLNETIGEFGTDHVYNCDTFNEMQPSNGSLAYLESIGKSIYGAMTQIDPRAIWLLQGWMFHSEEKYWTPDKAQALLNSIALGKMIVLDLQSEQFPQYSRLKSYFGQPYIWCMLHNFGGTSGMFGSLGILNQEPFNARNSNGSTMVGSGLSMEGINQNYMVYDFMGETSWKDGPTDLKKWVQLYATRRYGGGNKNAQEAWIILADTVYNYKGLMLMRGKYAITRTPSFHISTWIWYDICRLLEAWDQLLLAGGDFRDGLLYRHDLVDVTRQVLQNLGDQLYNRIMSTFNEKDVENFQYSKNASLFLSLFDDLNLILSTDGSFLLGTWLRDAKSAASSAKEAQLFEYNARNQVTLWGPGGEIRDYANKQWAGLVADYFKPRWQLFLNELEAALKSGKKVNQKALSEKIFLDVEKPFTFAANSYATQPTGDPVEIAQYIRGKWWSIGHCQPRGSTWVEAVSTQQPNIVTV